ncbi:MAG: hypothetical protein COA78_14425 [Blastopirellula sp.]|nr:MAG: hypothetical protein COA78_14425 [Blastopirellula sp.]
MHEQMQYHNPFPQLSKIAIVPFSNQSDVPTLNSEQVTIGYYGELQQIPGFEVVPVGVVRQVIAASGNDPTYYNSRNIKAIRELGEILGVDVVVVGSVTDFEPYYPKRATLAIDWYAVNPGFHPIPPGYGLPWGTSQEEFIPESHIREAEFALAKEQLETQTPLPGGGISAVPVDQVQAELSLAKQAELGSGIDKETINPEEILPPNPALLAEEIDTGLPENWPDPRGFIPPPPSEFRPVMQQQDRPIISQIRSYHENNSDFTEAAQNYVYHLDDSRMGGWQGFLDRSDDFIRFCCRLHITEMLSMRGGAGKSRVALRWVESR